MGAGFVDSGPKYGIGALTIHRSTGVVNTKPKDSETRDDETCCSDHGSIEA